MKDMKMKISFVVVGVIVTIVGVVIVVAIVIMMGDSGNVGGDSDGGTMVVF